MQERTGRPCTSQFAVLVDWALALVGAAVLGLVAGQLQLSGQPLGSKVLEVTVPFAIGTTLIAFGGWLTTTDYDSTDRFRIAAWASAGLAVLVLLSVWELFLLRIGDAALIGYGYQLITQLSLGTLAGAIVGYYDVLQQDLREQAELAQTAVETSRDGIAIVDGDRTFVEVNRAFTDLFGLETDALEGGSLDRCFHTEDADRLDEVMDTALGVDGEWRGELLGRRTDGTTFPIALSVASMADREMAVIVVRDISEQKRYENTIESLHGVTRELMSEESEQDVCRNVVETVELLLNYEYAGIWLVDESGERLSPAALTTPAATAFGEVSIPLDEASAMGTAFIQNRTVVENDGCRFSHQTNLASDSAVTLVPLGDYGVLGVAAEGGGGFAEEEVSMANLLGANARVALERAERERTLERQTEQLEFFNSILRHDVLNGLTVIQTRADVLSDHDDDHVRDMATTILAWCDDMSTIVSRVQRIIKTLASEGDINLEAVSVSRVLREELATLRETYPQVTYETEIQDGVTVLANELLGEVVGNILSNAIEHNDPASLTLSVAVERTGDTVTVRIADDGQGIPDDRKEAVLRREESGHAKSSGSGFGLFFVDSMIQRYGGRVSIEDTPAGGAAFIITLDAAGEH
ncbi:PAS domain S-box protein [Haloarcula sp. CBA1130]|uniref:sensor histidine kinase n=1 Tax=unclassified Haloarcula TaxID=2624677 RepID=UPI001243AC75|nr:MULTISPECIES: PAS domain S-box protein [unclassified Haloarcula]KAA9399539.1 PAS domain S-box protein [Haloarcula sp. CBA1129]KAA9401263.1 PAS domain S-box protein [Haloarcula sp. CBA1130]